MAQHLPIQTNSSHVRLVSAITKSNKIKNLKFFDRVSHGMGYIQRLTPEYEMNEYHGKIDDEILSFVLSNKTLEIHLDKNENINQIYLVG